jgi:hypothetical protein
MCLNLESMLDDEHRGQACSLCHAIASIKRPTVDSTSSALLIPTSPKHSDMLMATISSLRLFMDSYLFPYCKKEYS